MFGRYCSGRIALMTLACMSIVRVAYADPPTKPPTEQERQAIARFRQGAAFLDEGLYDDAIKEFQAAYQIVAEPVILFDSAKAFRLKGDSAEALEAYRRFLAAEDNGPEADEARTHVAELTKQLEEVAEKKARERREADDLARREAKLMETRRQ